MNDGTELNFRPPTHTGFIDDPVSGRPDALFNIWEFGCVDASISDAVTRISYLDAQLAQSTNEIDTKNTRDLIHLYRFSLAPYTTVFPEGAQFIAIGERACAVEVTYDRPLNTPPKLHPELDVIVSEITGGYYQTISNRLTRQTQPEAG